MREISVARIGNAETVVFACEELKKYLLAIDKTAVVDVLEYDSFEPDRKNVLWVGIDETFGKKMPEVKDKKLDDAILIDVTDFCGIISGGNDRSVLIAAYRFLRELGVKFVRPGPDGEVVPVFTLSKCRVSLCEVPSYRHRCVCIEGANAEYHVQNIIDWLPKVGMNEYFIQFLVPLTFFERYYKRTGNPSGIPEDFTNSDAARCCRRMTEEADRRSINLYTIGHGWTCFPFGVTAGSWETTDESTLPRDYIGYTAMINGKRGLKDGILLNTQLCYSNPAVRNRITDAVVEYSKNNPKVAYVTLSLADGTNNHCECDECRKKLPSEWLLDMLNEADEKLTKAGLDNKIKFSAYVDTMWAPKKGKLNNPDRFVLTLAPITRSFFDSYKTLDLSADVEIPEFNRNHNKYPRSVLANVRMFEEWLKQVNPDTVLFDYHMWAAHVRDLGYTGIAKILFDDCENLGRIKCNGYISCQIQRASLPTYLPQTAMAAALWNKNADYKTVSEDYYKSAFGYGWREAKKYLEKLTALSRPGYVLGTVKLNETSRKKLNDMQHEAYALVDGFLPTIEKYMSLNTDPTQKKSWEYLIYHREIAKRFILVFIADGEKLGKEKIHERYKDMVNYIFSVEPQIHNVYDAWRVSRGLNEWYN